MAVVVLERDVARPLEAVWAVVADVSGHRLPRTTVHTDPGPPRAGWRFRAISRVGPLHVTDTMVVTWWSPPNAGPREGPSAEPSAGPNVDAGYAVVKTGRVLSGWAQVGLHRLGPGRTRLRWREEILAHPHAVGRLIRPVTDLAVRAMFDRAVTEMLRRA